MTDVSKVIDGPKDRRIKQLNEQVEMLKGRLADSKSLIDVDKVRLQAKVSTLTSQVKKFMNQEQKTLEYVAEVKTAVQALDPLPAVAVVTSKKSKTPMTAVFHYTDWHVGEVIRAAETEGWGNTDWEIAQDRILGQLLPKQAAWLETQRSGYHINNIHLIETGDFISGDIHDELRRTNEFPIPVQTARAGHLLAAVAQFWYSRCETLYVTQVGADNHSRLVQKPQAKQKTSNSMSYLVYEIANQELIKHSNVQVTRAEGMKLLFPVNGIPFLGEHGDTVKSWMGIPFYGIEREKAREATRRMFDNRGFKFLIMGHWHVPWFASGLIVGGCLGGTSEYDHSCGRLSPPCQTGFLVGKRGPFGFVPFELR